LKSERTQCYSGPSLLEFLSTVEVDNHASTGLRMAVQAVTRLTGDFRGVAGTIASGAIRKDDEIIVLPSGRVTRIRDIVVGGITVDRAEARDDPQAHL
jgi:bifunctional enzyme CysN/CysC